MVGVVDDLLGDPLDSAACGIVAAAVRSACRLPIVPFKSVRSFTVKALLSCRSEGYSAE
jgi:hypothetical protein